jgi:hypothetical protein
MEDVVTTRLWQDCLEAERGMSVIVRTPTVRASVFMELVVFGSGVDVLRDEGLFGGGHRAGWLYETEKVGVVF